MEDMHMKQFLHQLYQMCGGDSTTDVSMYAIGDQLGLDKNSAGSVAEDLIIDGFAELKTLAGGITITAKGLDELGKSEGAAGDPPSTVHRLGSQETLTDDDLEAVGRVLDEVKQVVCSTVQRYDDAEELIVDIKTIDVQLLSPRPKTSVIKAVLAAIARQCRRHGEQQIAVRLNTLAGTE